VVSGCTNLACLPCCIPGAAIALRLRTAVTQQLGYTCSAGIGPNKLLAKIGSAKNKPNKQTLVLPRAVEGLMEVWWTPGPASA
jgi:DNA polymerase eta